MTLFEYTHIGVIAGHAAPRSTVTVSLEVSTCSLLRLAVVSRMRLARFGLLRPWAIPIARGCVHAGRCPACACRHRPRCHRCIMWNEIVFTAEAKTCGKDISPHRGDVRRADVALGLRGSRCKRGSHRLQFLGRSESSQTALSARFRGSV